MLEIDATLQVRAGMHEVFEAIVDPDKMSHYFISGSSGRMEEGRTLTWHFPEFEEGFRVRTGRIEKDSYISYRWDADGKELLVEIALTDAGNGSTLVRITEKSMENDEAGIKWLKGNTEGWANFLACLKAYLEFGINLRRGGFDFLRK